MGNVMVSVMVRTPSAPARSARATWVPMTMRRLSNRSESRPPHGASSRTGTYCRAVTNPMAVPLPVNCNTNQPRAMICIHEPAIDTACPEKYRRKLRPWSDEKVPSQRALTGSPGRRPVHVGLDVHEVGLGHLG